MTKFINAFQFKAVSTRLAEAKHFGLAFAPVLGLIIVFFCRSSVTPTALKQIILYYGLFLQLVATWWTWNNILKMRIDTKQTSYKNRIMAWSARWGECVGNINTTNSGDTCTATGNGWINLNETKKTSRLRMASLILRSSKTLLFRCGRQSKRSLIIEPFN